MKRILLSLAVIALVGGGAAALSFTGAFFSDTETSTGNTFSSGSIDLKVDSQAHYDGLICQQGENGYTWQIEDSGVGTQRPDLVDKDCSGSWTMTDLGPTNQFFNLSDLKPGDSGENTLSLHVDNNDAYACVTLSNLHDDDLSLTSPEYKDGDPSSGPDQGEMASQLHFFAWDDNGGTEQSGGVAGDNIWNGDEQPLFSNLQGPASDVINGVSYPLYTPQTQSMPAGSTDHIGMYWCYGDITVDTTNHTLSCDGSSANNLTQTDRLTADVSFYVEQARNNSGFTCQQPEAPTTRTIKVGQNDLDPNAANGPVSPAVVAADGLGDWFFYNDTTDEVNNTLGTIAAGPDSPTMGPGSAQMTLSDANGRIALATYQFAGTPLTDITELKYSVNPSSASGAASLQFNIDFNDPSVAPVDSWQHRLLFEPGENGDTVNAGQWNTFDGVSDSNGWSWSGLSGHGGSAAYWPDGTTPASQTLTWAQIISKWPNARIRVSDPWLGFRTGSPGPTGLMNGVDYFTVDTTGNPATTFNFTN